MLRKRLPWITSYLKTAIKCKHRVYKKYVKRGSKTEEWEHVKTLSQNTFQMITSVKEKYFLKLSQKLSDSANGVKAYWSTLNKILNRNKMTNILPLSENSVFITNYQTKADVFNEFFAKQCSLLPNDSSFLLVPKNVTKFYEVLVLIDRTFYHCFIPWTQRRHTDVMICPSLC